MENLELIEKVFSIILSVATVALVFLFWKTIKQLEETVKLSRIQSTYRFRPWVGPSTGIEQMASNTDGHNQYYITLKNFGEIPTSNIVARFTSKSDEISRDELKSISVDGFNLGPLLPYMEKRYWFFIDSDLVEKAKNGSNDIFTLLYFTYDHLGGKSGYGMISQFDPKTNSFLHKNMWVD